MRHRKTAVGLREHIGPHAWVRLPLPLSPGDPPPPQSPEPTDLPVDRVAVGSR
jgi:hypothetical protein